MNKRIGLFTHASAKEKTARTSTASYVEIIAAADLAEKLAHLGAKRVGLLRRDRQGVTHLEGAMFAPTDLKEEHVDWVVAPTPGFETRGIFYEQK